MQGANQSDINGDLGWRSEAHGRAFTLSQFEPPCMDTIFGAYLVFASTALQRMRAR
jgi:hypothetical protein